MNPLEFTIQWTRDFKDAQKRNFLAKALRSERRRRDAAYSNPSHSIGALTARLHQQQAVEIFQYARLNAPSK